MRTIEISDTLTGGYLVLVLSPSGSKHSYFQAGKRWLDSLEFTVPLAFPRSSIFECGGGSGTVIDLAEWQFK